MTLVIRDDRIHAELAWEIVPPLRLRFGSWGCLMVTMDLCERRRMILAAVVNDYVETAEPVGSEALVRKYSFGVKSATIRNELAAMSDLGYLLQPHTSAGRVPSDLGYRYYVDELMPDPQLGPGETDHARQSYDPFASEVEDILQRTCRILSSLTRYMSLATPPRMEAVRIRQVALLSVGVGKLLAVIVLNSGHIDHRTIDYSGDLSITDMAALGNIANERLHEADLGALNAHADDELPMELASLISVYRKVVAVLRQALTSAMDDEIYVDGTLNILKQPEFVHGGKVASLLETLEHRREIFQTLSSTLLGGDVKVIIGSENRFEDMRDCSFVASSYSVAGRVCGTVGVIGPTRMDYRHAVAAVEFMALSLSDLLTSLSIG